jgi:hypothetical protein
VRIPTIKPFAFGVLAAVTSGVLVNFILAGMEVDQGKPGRYGSWPVSVSSGSLSLSSSVTPDGGYTSIVPLGAAWSRTSNLVGVPSNGVACTTVGGASCTIIFPSTSLVLYQNMTITISNVGANAIDNVLVEWSADDTNREIWDTTTFSGIAAGVTKSLAMTGNSRRYLRIEARSASGSTAQVYVDATAQAF